MLCHKVGVSRCDFWKLAFQRGGDTAVQLLPSAAQQSALGGILHQGVLESVFCVWRRPAPEN